MGKAPGLLLGGKSAVTIGRHLFKPFRKCGSGRIEHRVLDNASDLGEVLELVELKELKQYPAPHCRLG